MPLISVLRREGGASGSLGIQGQPGLLSEILGQLRVQSEILYQKNKVLILGQGMEIYLKEFKSRGYVFPLIGK